MCPGGGAKSEPGTSPHGNFGYGQMQGGARGGSSEPPAGTELSSHPAGGAVLRSNILALLEH